MTEQQSDKKRDEQRLEISIDGSHACALWGKDLHDGEAVFVAVEGWPHHTQKQVQAAMREAYELLCKAIGDRLPFDIVRTHEKPSAPLPEIMRIGGGASGTSTLYSPPAAPSATVNEMSGILVYAAPSEGPTHCPECSMNVWGLGLEHENGCKVGRIEQLERELAHVRRYADVQFDAKVKAMNALDAKDVAATLSATTQRTYDDGLEAAACLVERGNTDKRRAIGESIRALKKAAPAGSQQQGSDPSGKATCAPGGDTAPAGAALSTTGTLLRADRGPWSVRRLGAGTYCIYSGDFVHDVELLLTGDFKNEEQEMEYAADVARVLQAATASATTERK